MLLPDIFKMSANSLSQKDMGNREGLNPPLLRFDI